MRQTLGRLVLNHFAVILLLFFLTLLFFGLDYSIWENDFFEYPYTYGHDGLESLKIVKHLVTGHGFWTANEFLGYPQGSNIFVQYPTADFFTITEIQLLSFLSKNHFLVFNLHVLLTYIFASFSGYLVLTAVGINKKLSLFGALVFTFLPYHQIRVFAGHIFLIQYYSVSLTVALALALLGYRGGYYEQIFESRLLKWLLAILIIFAVSTAGGVYYTFFSLLIWGLATAINFIACKNYKIILGYLVISLLSVLIVLAQLVPFFRWQLQQNGFVDFPNRDLLEIESNGLRLNRMFVPLPSQLFSLGNDWLTEYYSGVQHEQFQFIGFVGLFGLLACFSCLFKSGKNINLNKEERHFFRYLSFLILGVIFVASSGGLGLVIGHTITSVIRAYGRISIYIAFIGIFCFLFFWQKIEKKFQSNQKKLIIFYLISGIFSIYAFLYQLNVSHPGYYADDIKNQFYSDKDLMGKVRGNLPVGTKVFQLPITQYPGALGGCSFDSYDLFKPYLHGDEYSWSFGSLADSESFVWQSNLQIEGDIEEFIGEIVGQGFGAVYLDVRSCEDMELIKNEILDYTNGELYLSESRESMIIDLKNFINQPIAD